MDANLTVTYIDSSPIGFLQSHIGPALRFLDRPPTRVDDNITQEQALAFEPLLIIGWDSPSTPDRSSVNTRRLTLFKHNNISNIRAVVVPADAHMIDVNSEAARLGYDQRPVQDLGLTYEVADGLVLLRLNGGRLGWLAEYIAARQTSGFPIHGRTSPPSVVESGPTWIQTGLMLLKDARPYRPPNEVADELIDNIDQLHIGWITKGRFEYLTKSFDGLETWLRILFDRSPAIEFYKNKDVVKPHGG